MLCASCRVAPERCSAKCLPWDADVGARSLPPAGWSQVRKLESQGVPTKQAEAITSAITEVLNDSLESISESFVSKAEMQKVTPHIACRIVS